MPWVASGFSTTPVLATGRVKLGQPVPESNLSSELNSGSPDTTSTYKPGLWLSQYALWKAGSVPHCWVTTNCSEDSFFFSVAGSGFLKSFMLSGSKVDVSAGCARPWRTIATRPTANNTTAAIPAILIEDIRFRCFQFSSRSLLCAPEFCSGATNVSRVPRLKLTGEVQISSHCLGDTPERGSSAPPAC